MPNTASRRARRCSHWIVAISARRSDSMRSTGMRGPSSRSSRSYSSGAASRTECTVKRPRGSTTPATRTHEPAAIGAGAASSVPVRSPSTTRRASLVRTIRTWSIWSPGVRSRTRTVRGTLGTASDEIPSRTMPARTALVTGGAGGLGRSVVAALVEDGWNVVVPVETEGDLDGAATVLADLTDPDDVARALRAAEDPLKAVVNLVGGFAADQPVETTPIA